MDVIEPKNTHQKRGRNNEQTKIWNIYGKDVKENAIGVVLSIPLKYLVELYQKYMPKSEVHLANNVDPRRDTPLCRGHTQLNISSFCVDSQKEYWA